MFTGIVQGIGGVISVSSSEVTRISISIPDVTNLVVGASVAIDGVCLTVVDIDGSVVSFDVIPETLNLTTIGDLCEGSKVNFERALRLGDELGGHILSGHIMGTGLILDRNEGDDYLDISIEVDSSVMRFIQPKGYIAIDGISLTIGEVGSDYFDLHLIPETLRMTTLGQKKLGQKVNVEIDGMTQNVVSTIERMMELRT